MPHTPFQARLLRLRDAGSARRLLEEALAQGDRESLVGGDYPYDLDLAGMLFPLQNRGQRPDEDVEEGRLSLGALGALCADAAWAMCLDGLLRPGARSPLDKTARPSSGFCLTERGRVELGPRAA